MRGTVLDYDKLAGEGVISGSDGGRYAFRGLEWKAAPSQLQRGASVDFEVTDGLATAIYATGPAPASVASADQKSPLVAGLLALFLGGLGIHKFYLGYNGPGITLLIGTITSWVLTIVVIGLLGLMLISIICLIEAIIYLTKNQEEFTQTYVVGRKDWF